MRSDTESRGLMTAIRNARNQADTEQEGRGLYLCSVVLRDHKTSYPLFNGNVPTDFAWLHAV